MGVKSLHGGQISTKIWNLIILKSLLCWFCSKNWKIKMWERYTFKIQNPILVHENPDFEKNSKNFSLKKTLTGIDGNWWNFFYFFLTYIEEWKKLALCTSISVVCHTSHFFIKNHAKTALKQGFLSIFWKSP